uniref:J domain-containing protein n=2 Tax=Parascaris TaxID=6254 RepID=A0A914ZH61_PARUN
MEANRQEAERCMDIAREAIRDNNASKAIKFLHKAVKLDPSSDIRYLLEKAKNMGAETKEKESNVTGTDAGYGHYDQYEKESELRSRKTQFHASQSQPSMNTERGCPDGADEGSSSSAEPKRGRSRSAGRPILGVHYTKEEAETVERIRHCKDYYEILNLKKDATEAQLKREYRKLALQLHPDKCRAPGATEAFKALGNAYAVLTNKEKRAQYDLYGTEGPRRRSSADGDFYEYDYGRGFEAEFTPEEIFNMFFGGGYPAGHLNRRHRGAQYHFHQHQTGQQEQSPYGPILQLLPLFAVIFLGLIAQLMVGDPAFSLHRDSKYSEERFTKDLQVPYYVKTDFLANYRNRIPQVEHQVEDEYISQLRMNCYKERNQKETLAWRARTFGDAEMWHRAQRIATPSCDRLQQIYS